MRRTKPEIVFAILEVIQENIAKKEEIRKTQIMYRANLSFAQTNIYLSRLKDLDLISEIEREGENNKRYNVFELTENGYKFFRSLKSSFKLIKEI